MIVVADASPLHYLILIGEVELLPALFGTALIPEAVFQELQHAATPSQVHRWLGDRPAWLKVHPVAAAINEALLYLDPGEREAIQLAMEMGIGTVLMDETEGRRQAVNLHLEVRGTLGILERGARLGLVDFRHSLHKLEQTSFRLSRWVREAFLRRNL